MVTGDGKVENSISTLIFWFSISKKELHTKKLRLKGRTNLETGSALIFYLSWNMKTMSVSKTFKKKKK